MAITVTEITAADGARGNVKIWDITKSADADATSGNIAHGLGVAPEEVILTPLSAKSSIALGRVSTIDATNLVVTFETTAGSATASFRLIAKRPSVLTR